jgi:O-antigen ligase
MHAVSRPVSAGRKDRHADSVSLHRGQRRSLPHPQSRAELWPGLCCAMLLAMGLTFGGGTANNLISDLLVQLLAIAVLVWGLQRLEWTALARSQRQLLGVMACLMAVPVLQLIPLPTAFSSLAPGRAEIFAGRAAVGLVQPTFAPWSLDPGATLAAFRSLLPAAALAVLGLQLSAAWLKRLTMLVVLLALVMVPLGIAQVAQGAQSELRPYVPTNVHDAVGLFANRNHYAAFLVTALVFVMAHLVHRDPYRSAGSTRVLQQLGWLIAGAMLLVGIMLSRSRAGVALAGLAVTAFLVIAFLRRREDPATFRWLFGFALAGGLMAFQFGFSAIADRLSQSGDYRLQLLPAVLDLAKSFAWLGSGLGSFASTYAAHEPIEVLGAKILTHAHNDWAELWVELGFLLVPLTVLVGAWLWSRGREILPRAVDHSLHFSGFLIIFLLCLHSLVDYSLRTTSVSMVMVLAAMLCAHSLRHEGQAASADRHSGHGRSELAHHD